MDGYEIYKLASMFVSGVIAGMVLWSFLMIESPPEDAERPCSEELDDYEFRLNQCKYELLFNSQICDLPDSCSEELSDYEIRLNQCKHELMFTTHILSHGNEIAFIVEEDKEENCTKITDVDWVDEICFWEIIDITNDNKTEVDPDG